MPNPAALLALVGAGVGALLLTSKKGSAAQSGVSGVQYPGAASALNAAAASASSAPVRAAPPPPIPIPTSTTPAPPAPPVVSAAPAPPAPPPLVPTPVAIPPAPDPTMTVTTAPDGGVTTTLAPIEIDAPAPAAAAPAAAPAASTVPPWGSTTLPNVSGIAIPGSYMTPGSPETTAVQNALNTWATEVGYGGAEIPLVVDGTYGPNTQQAAASFQAWVNATGQGSLTIDGLAGPQTQAHLADFAPMSAGGY